MRHVQCNTAPHATRTVQHHSICDTYSALTPIHAICDTYICGMHGGELFNDVQNEQATHLVSSSSIHGSVLLRNTSQSSPGQLQITFISRGSKLAVVPGPSLSRAPTFPQNATMYREAGARRGVVHFNLECPHSEFPQSSMD